MKIISHRGNVRGPIPEKENRPSYIDCALGNGYDVEIDINTVNGELWLGHDKPQYKITHTWLECCLLYTSPSPRDGSISRMPSSA